MHINSGKSTAKLLIALASLGLAGCASTGGTPESGDVFVSEFDRQDPLQPMNRVIFAFNDTIDRYALRPAAKAYKDYMPQPVQTGVHNFFENLREPRNAVSNTLQGKFSEAVSDTGRFLVNSTLGLAGTFDPASRMGLEKSDEDLGQVLGAWGVPSGPFLMLPIFGPSSLRDAPAQYADGLIWPPNYMNDEGWSWGAVAGNAFDARAQLVGPDEQIFGDRYAAIRDLWIQTREAAVLDGMVEDDF
jgi:phospholipid-binding lipoprotein MlaA